MDNFAEAIRIAPCLYLQAQARKFRLHRLLSWEADPGEVIQENGDIEVTRQLLSGACCAAVPSHYFAGKAPGISVDATHSLLSYIYSLAGAYQTTHATPSTMRRVAEHYAARGLHATAAYCRHVAEEESGHDTLALMDLAALGLPAQELVARLRPKNSLALVELLARFADSARPIAVLGYAYALERMALFSTEASIAAIERLVPPGVNATRCLKVHSSVGGTETMHVADSIAFISRLPPQDRAIIARAAYQTGSLLFAASDYPGDAAMRALLDEFGWAMAEEALT